METISHSTTPAATWRAVGEPDPHGDRYDCERAALAHGNLTDDELANAVFMCDHRSSFESIGWLTAAIDRIRWLSRALVRAQTAATVQAAICDAAAERRKGRAEALQLLIALDPEGGIEDYIGWSASSAPEDEGNAFWDEDKLRELLDIDTDLPDMLAKAEAEYYHQSALREEAERIAAAAAEAHEGLRDQVGQALSDELASGAEQPDWCDSREIDRLANAAMLVLLTNASHERTNRASAVGAPKDSQACWCSACRPITLDDMRMVLCPTCGNKRCPHATDHHNACSGSNEPGQMGGSYGVPRMDSDLYAAVAKLIKAKGRFHTEQNYAAVVAAFDRTTAPTIKKEAES